MGPHELTFTATRPGPNPYTDVDFWVDFRRQDGTVLRRPGYWDGGTAFGVRFTAAGGWAAPGNPMADR